ncbi:hypothetical protein [Actinomadura rubrisoli]|uniref:hypothetical protein n=1 Tax=Actinomadura rubrisoli TaxID=2530368 RepID=UPI0014042BCA|nr:hypothetical protein [Actinomadura rubrisoli]
MRYEEIPDLTREDLENALLRQDDEAAQNALLSLALHGHDWKWVQDQCLGLLNNPSQPLRSTAVICLGHIARIHKKLDLDRVLPALRHALNDPQTAGYAEQAIDDIELFIPAR